MVPPTPTVSSTESPADDRANRAGGRHRAARPHHGARRAAVAVVAAGAPLLPAALLAAPAAADTDWDELAECESSGNWSINTGNGFGGGLQFTDSTWKAFGGSGQPEDASREEQIAVAERVKAEQGMNAWPTCSKKTGNTSNAPNDSVPTASPDSSSSSTQTASSSSGSSGASASESSSESSSTSVSSAPSRPGGDYTVKAGDTLSSIAASHGTSWRSLQSSNTDVLGDPNMIFPGQVIDL